MFRLKQKGFSLVEFAAVAALVAMAYAGTAWVNAQRDVYTPIDNAADAIAKVGIAVDNLIAKHANAYVDGTPVVENGVTFANAYQPTIAELIASGMLTNFNPASLPGGQMNTVISLAPAGCTPPNCNVTWLSNTTRSIINPLTAQVDESLANRMVQRIGADSAASLTASPTILRGYNNSWTAANPINLGGIVAVRGGYGASVLAKFLRTDGGNQMAANLRVGGNNIVDVNNMTATGTVQAATANATTANITTGNIATVNATDVTASQRVTAARVNITSTSAAGAGCSNEGDVIRDGLSTSAGLLVCRSGRYVTVGNVAAGAMPESSCMDEGSFARDVTAGATGLLLCRSGVYKKVGGLDVVTAGGACTSLGALAQTAAGTAVICQGSIWIDLRSRIGQFAFIASFEVQVTPASQGVVVSKPSCLANGVGKIYLIPKSDDQVGYVNHYAQDFAGFWRVYATDGDNVGRNAVMLAQTYCYYA